MGSSGTFAAVSSKAWFISQHKEQAPFAQDFGSDFHGMHTCACSLITA